MWNKILALAVALVAPLLASAQIYEDMDYDFRGRVGAEADFKIAPGLHIGVSEEARFADDFRSFDRFMTSASLNYKPLKFLRLGVGYTFMSMYETEEAENQSGEAILVSGWDLRHRVNADVTGILKMGGFRLSLRERYQLTARTGEFNRFQSPALEHVLRTRVKLSYVCRRVPLEPYASFEARLLLNGINTDEIARSKNEIGKYEPTFDHVYFNRYRSQIGLGYAVNSHHSFDFYVMGDYVRGIKADTNTEGKLKKVQVLNAETGAYETREAIYYRKGFNTTAGIAYKFSF